jgi:hypothetical protein
MLNHKPSMEVKHTSPGDRVYEACWQDGSIDLFAGVAAAGIGVAWIFDLVVMGPIAPALAIPLWVAFRRRVIEPRLGHVRFDSSRRRRLKRAHVVLIAVGCATLILGVATYFASGGARPEWFRSVVPALPGVLVGIAGALSALMFAIPRLALYAVPFVLGGLGVAALDTDPGWALLAGGLVAATTGCVLLVRFAWQFPLLSNVLD